MTQFSLSRTDVDQAYEEEKGRPHVRLGAVLPPGERLAGEKGVEDVLAKGTTEPVCDLSDEHVVRRQSLERLAG